MAMPAPEGRIGELLAEILPRQRKAWFDHLETRQVELGAIEHDLAALPGGAWHTLMRNILGQINRHQPRIGWPQMRDLLHEARAFHYLAELDCSEIAFSSPTMQARYPDLTARLGTHIVLCEVKTVRLTGGAIWRKLRARLHDAEQQLASVGDETARRLIYLILDPGDRPSVTADQLRAKLPEIAQATIPLAWRIVIDTGEAGVQPWVAERVGFEPTIGVTLCTLSKRVP